MLPLGSCFVNILLTGRELSATLPPARAGFRNEAQAEQLPCWLVAQGESTTLTR